MSGATARRTDTDCLYEILGSRPNWWFSQGGILDVCQTLHGHGMTVHSRASDLRKRGFTVECKVERHNGRAKSFYRLVTQ